MSSLSFLSLSHGFSDERVARRARERGPNPRCGGSAALLSSRARLELFLELQRSGGIIPRRVAVIVRAHRGPNVALSCWRLSARDRAPCRGLAAAPAVSGA